MVRRGRENEQQKFGGQNLPLEQGGKKMHFAPYHTGASTIDQVKIFIVFSHIGREKVLFVSQLSKNSIIHVLKNSGLPKLK